MQATEPEEAQDDGVFRLKDMSELLADFGQADPNWKNMKITEETTPAEPTESRLAPQGKAPIHISLCSFGYSKGAPPRPAGWSQSLPLAPIDVRDLFETVPKYLEWRDGLSGAVKQALKQENRDGTDIQGYAKSTVADQVWEALLEAQTAGYGYASPLTMTVHVGSESGKHRSVVICEWAAIQIRKLLRTNDNNIIQQPVSVGTIHREIEKRKSSNQQNQKKKPSDFGADW